MHERKKNYFFFCLTKKLEIEYKISTHFESVAPLNTFCSSCYLYIRYNMFNVHTKNDCGFKKKKRGYTTTTTCFRIYNRIKLLHRMYCSALSKYRSKNKKYNKRIYQSWKLKENTNLLFVAIVVVVIFFFYLSIWAARKNTAFICICNDKKYRQTITLSFVIFSWLNSRC